MILRSVCWSVFLCLVLQQTVKTEVVVTEQGYQNVLISFSQNVPSENGQELIANIQELLENTSSVLHTAIGIRIATATLLLPPSWSTEGWEGYTINPASFEQAKTKPDISVDATKESCFGKQPVALQHGGCGVPGHQITLPADFLSSATDFPKDKLLAREWLKHRYGVFEENGFKNDELYPDYYRIPGSSDIRITECTNTEVKYKFKRPVDGEECTTMDKAEFGLCRPHIEEENAANVTSSLMYFHQELQDMTHVCGKDDNPHHSSTLSKQNVLCKGRSIWEVVNSSKDFEISQQELNDAVPEPIQFSFAQPNQPGFIVVLEDSANLNSKQSSIKLALRRFYYDLPPKSKLAIYTFSSEAKKVTEDLSYNELPAQGRANLGPIASFIASKENICPSCGLLKAIETLQQSDDVRKVTILLVTASSLDKVPEIPENLKTSAISLNVIRFAAAEYADVDATYDELKGKFGSYSFVQINDTSVEADNFLSLYNFLKNPVPETNDFNTITVASGVMWNEKKVAIPEDARASLYTLWVNTQYKDADSIVCKAGEKEVELANGMSAPDISSYTFAPVEGEVTCGLSSSLLPQVLTHVQITTQKGYYFDFNTWFHDSSTETEQAPIIIYAKIYFGGHPVKDANVIATIIKENKPEEETANASSNVEEVFLKMLDNGRGDPDITLHDGVYSGYFTEFKTTGEYQITVKVDNNEGRAKIGKEEPDQVPATCCGSRVVNRDGDVPAFQMEKMTLYTALNKMPEDGYPPSRIVDLRVEQFNSQQSAKLTWTAPGAGKASSYEFYVFCDLEDCDGGRLPQWLKINESELIPKSHGESEEIVVLFASDMPTLENQTLLFAIKSLGERGKKSDLSNKAEIFLSPQLESSTTMQPSTPITIEGRKIAASDKIGLIVAGILVGILVLICVGALFYFYFKPRRSKSIDSSGCIQDKNQDGSEVSGSFRAIPVRVRGSMRRVESFPVMLYTHDQLKDFKKKVDPPLYKPDIAPRPWMSMNVLSNSEPNRGGDSKSIGSASTLPMNDRHRSTEMKQLDDVSLASDTPHADATIKF